MNKWKGDDLHIDSDIQKMDGCNKLWNLIVTERESGKSTLLWKKVYNTFKDKKRPSILVKRFQTDITDLFIDGVAIIIGKFTDQQITFKYNKGDLRAGGILDLKIIVDGKEQEGVFCRIVALNTPLSRLKSQVLLNPRYIFEDEFICNKRLKERYLEDEVFRLKEGVYNTYLRFVEKKDLTIYLFGNPYSVVNPYVSYLKIDANKIYPGSFLVGEGYCMWNYQIKPELKAKLLEGNPLYQFDDAYKAYAYDGRAIQDINIKILKNIPENFRLEYVFKIHGKTIGLYHGYQFEPEKLFYYAKLIDKDQIGAWRDVLCFDFGEMADKTVLVATGNKMLYYAFREAVEHRWIAFASAEEGWLIEEIYQSI